MQRQSSLYHLVQAVLFAAFAAAVVPISLFSISFASWYLYPYPSSLVCPSSVLHPFLWYLITFHFSFPFFLCSSIPMLLFYLAQRPLKDLGRGESSICHLQCQGSSCRRKDNGSVSLYLGCICPKGAYAWLKIRAPLHGTSNMCQRLQVCGWTFC